MSKKLYDATSQYALTAQIRYCGRLPRGTELRGGHVIGTLSMKRADPMEWTESPHVVLANIPTYDAATIPHAFTTKPMPGLADPKAMEVFVKKHGVLWADINETTARFDEDAARFAEAQALLRRAWTGDKAAIKELLVQVNDALEAKVSFRAREIEIATENLWSFICVLFLRDFAVGKTKVCARLDCPHPYFLEKRKGQKYCGHKCTMFMTVRRFRARQKARKKGRG